MKQTMIGIAIALSSFCSAMTMNRLDKNPVLEIHIGEGNKRYIRQQEECMVEYAERIARQKSVEYTGSKNARKIKGAEARELYARLWEENISNRLQLLELLALKKK